MQENASLRIDVPLPEERVFRYQAMQDVLHHLLNDPLEGFTQKELASMTGADVSTISRSLHLLDRLGLLSMEEGTPARVSIDHDHLEHSDPLFMIPQREFRESVKAYLEELRSRVASSEVVRSIVGILLFGSVARGTADRTSDIDLLVIVDGEPTDGRRVCSKTARDVEEETFDGDRYEFEVLVETPTSVTSHGDGVRDLFDEGIVLERSDALTAVRDDIYDDG